MRRMKGRKGVRAKRTNGNGKKGSVTAFLSLVFVLLVSFILALTESAALQTAKNVKRMDADRAAFSAFGEYEKDLLEEYGIFALDGAYGSDGFAEDRILGRMAYYGSMGIGQEVTEIQLLTDTLGQPFREQVLTCMEEKTGISLVRDLTGMAADWEAQEIQGEELSGQLDAVLEEGSALLPEEASGVVQAKAGGLLALVLPKEFVLSGKAVAKETQASVRGLHAGRGSFPARTAIGGMEERLLFEQYLLEHFQAAVEENSGAETGERSLDYELEYILCGESSDAENLKQVVNRMLLFRFAGDYFYLMTNTAKQEEAAALGLTIATVLLNPEAAEVIKHMILLLWAFGESVMDLRALLSGKKVPLMKNEESWQLSLAELFLLGTAEDRLEGREAASGLTYVQYLQILLFLEKDSALTMRTIDRVEENIRHRQGGDGFQADNCVTKIKLHNTAEIRSGVSYSFPLYFGYM